MATDPALVSTLEDMADRLDEKLGGLRTDMAVEAEKRDKRIRTNRITTWAAVLVGVLGIVVGAVGVVAALDARSNLAAYLADRNVARVASCFQSNEAVQKNADVVKQNFDDFIDLLVSYAGGTADVQKVQNAKDRQHASIQKVADTPLAKGGLRRDCSPAGIKAFLSGR